MLKKTGIILSLILMTAVVTSAADKTRAFPRVTFGLEGSYAVTFLTFNHYNYISAEGYRVNSKKYDTGIRGNGQLLLNVGCNVSRNLNLALYTGMTGIYSRGLGTPLTLRATVLFGQDPDSRRWFTFADGGVIADWAGEPRVSPCGKLGGGYRIRLSRSVKLDFIVAYQMLVAHPPVNEDIGGTLVPVAESRLRRSDTWGNSLAFGIGLVF